MTENSRSQTGLSRRSFLKWSAAASGATAVLAGAEFSFVAARQPSLAQETGSAERMVRTCCPAHPVVELRPGPGAAQVGDGLVIGFDRRPVRDALIEKLRFRQLRHGHSLP